MPKKIGRGRKVNQTTYATLGTVGAYPETAAMTAQRVTLVPMLVPVYQVRLEYKAPKARPAAS